MLRKSLSPSRCLRTHAFPSDKIPHGHVATPGLSDGEYGFTNGRLPRRALFPSAAPRSGHPCGRTVSALRQVRRFSGLRTPPICPFPGWTSGLPYLRTAGDRGRFTRGISARIILSATSGFLRSSDCSHGGGSLLPFKAAATPCFLADLWSDKRPSFGAEC